LGLRCASFFVVRFMSKRCILEQKCQKGQIGTLMLGTRWYKSHNAQRYRQTDRQTDGQTDGQQAAGNSRSYCVTVRSAKNDKKEVVLFIECSDCAYA